MSHSEAKHLEFPLFNIERTISKCTQCSMFLFMSSVAVLILFSIYPIYSYYQQVHTHLFTEIIDDGDYIQTTLLIFLAISGYKLLELALDSYRSLQRVDFISFKRNYFGVLLLATVVSYVSLQLLIHKYDIGIVLALLLSAEVVTLKVAMRTCIDSYWCWEQTLWHSVFVFSYSTSDILLAESNFNEKYFHVCIGLAMILQLCCFGCALTLLDLVKLSLHSPNLKDMINTLKDTKLEVSIVFVFLLVKMLYSILSLYQFYGNSLFEFAYFNCLCYFGLVVSFSHVPHNTLLTKFYTSIDELNAKGTYVSYTTHEIRSPLTTVVMGIDLLIDEVSNDQISLDKEGIQETLKDLRVSSEMSLSVVNDLLTLDKFQADKFSLEPSLISAWEYITSSIRPFHIQAKAFHIKLVCRVQEGVDKNTTGILIDKTKAEPLIRNLVSNALKFSSKKSTVTVELSAQSTFTIRNEDSVSEKNRKKSLLVGTDGVLRISVKDHGPGISKADQLKLFGLFVQINPNQLQQGKGSGIGLWLSKKIAEVHGGIIGVESLGEGHGACFYFELPCFQLNKKISNFITGDNNLELVLQLDDPISDDMISSTSNHQSNSPKRNKIDCKEEVFVECKSATSSPRFSLMSTPNSTPTKMSAANSMLRSASLVELASNLRHNINSTQELKYNILMVDDMPMIRKMAARSFEPLYIVFSQASDGCEAIDIIKNDLDFYDIILLDGFMPKMDGFETAKSLRNLGFKGLIFGVTGSSSEDDRDSFLQSGANDVLQKPLILSKLRSAISSCDLK